MLLLILIENVKCTIEIMQLIQKKSGKEDKRQQKNRWKKQKSNNKMVALTTITMTGGRPINSFMFKRGTFKLWIIERQPDKDR